MTSVSLADIRAAAERKFGSYEVNIGDGKVVALRHALRLGEKDRAQLFGLLDIVNTLRTDAGNGDEGGGDGGDGFDVRDIEPLVDVIRRLLRLVADRFDYANELIDAVGDDLPVLIELLEGYMEVAQPGEASPSDA